MGQEVKGRDYGEEDRKRFNTLLRGETKHLMNLFNGREFEYNEVANIGLEVEAWLVTKDHLPLPENDRFLELAKNPLLVHELSQFNFELNIDPCPIQGGSLQTIYDRLSKLWAHCRTTAKDMNAHPLLIGILPMIKNEMLQLEFMSKSNRYRAMNDQLMKLRENKSIPVDIDGKDSLQLQLDTLMMEAAATSIQVHLQVNQENSCRFMNASMIASAPLVAVSANSPFLYGKDLWDETRIPVFEQAVRVASFRDKKGNDIGRVTFGTGYARNSLLEFFLENLDGYPCLLPELFDSPESKMNHLKLQNGTVWRWNRPIIGNDANGTPHLRIEQRVMASGPSIRDIVANMAFYLGLAYYYANLPKAPEESMTFTDCRENFYTAAKFGLGANIRWFGKSVNMQTLVLENLLPAAIEGLKIAQVEKEEIEYYLGDIMYHRVLSGQNGATWQRSFADCYGLDMQALSQSYLSWQEKEIPVHEWKI